MKRIRIYAALSPGGIVPYHDEYIYSVKYTREHQGTTYYCVENDVWVKELGPDKYVTDWTNEEVWGRAVEEEVDGSGKVISSKNLGFIILSVDRRNGVVFDILFRDTNITDSLKG